MRGPRRGVIAMVSLSALLLVAAIVAAQGPREGRADLESYQEVPTLSTSGAGSLRVSINSTDTAVNYTLGYGSLEGSVLQAHIHLGRPAINGGIMVYLCANPPLGPPPTAPATPSCPPPGGTVSGTLTAADVIGPSGQGVAAGQFAEFLAALRREAAYGNVHTSLFPGGEIRGQVTFHAHGAAIR